MAPGLIGLMRKNWKLNMFLVPATTFAIYYSYDYTFTRMAMEDACFHASKLGDAKIDPATAQPRHITVILNPLSGKRKSRKLYQKWVEPILHLSGIKVSLVETDSMEQIYDLMRVMSNCDGVAIVGGDGTVHQAINGLLHRADAATAVRKYPIAIMPTGQYNGIARYLYQGYINYRNREEFLIQSTAQLVKNQFEPYDVLKIKELNDSTQYNREDEDNDKTIYALRDVRYGRYQDSYVKIGGFIFYQTKIRPLWLRAKSLISQYFQNAQVEAIAFTEPCDGCSRCIGKHRLKELQLPQSGTNKKWFGVIPSVTRKSQSAEELKDMELAKMDNPDCDKWKQLTDVSNITEVRASMIGDKTIRLSLSHAREFIPSDTREVQDIKLKLAADLDASWRESESAKIEAAEMKKAGEVSQDATHETGTDKVERTDGVKSTNNKQEEKDDKTTKFLIDGQPTQARSIEITTVHNAVRIFTGSIKGQTN